MKRKNKVYRYEKVCTCEVCKCNKLEEITSLIYKLDDCCSYGDFLNIKIQLLEITDRL